MSLEYSSQVDVMNLRKGIRHTFYFKDKEGNLISYIVATVVENDYGNCKSKVCYINDITSGNGFDLLPDRIKEIYIDFGTCKKTGLKNFGEIALNDLIKYMKFNFPDLGTIVVNGLEKNKNHIIDLMDRVKNKFGNILEISMGNGEYVCTLKI